MLLWEPRNLGLEPWKPACLGLLLNSAVLLIKSILTDVFWCCLVRLPYRIVNYCSNGILCRFIVLVCTLVQTTMISLMVLVMCLVHVKDILTTGMRIIGLKSLKLLTSVFRHCYSGSWLTNLGTSRRGRNLVKDLRLVKRELVLSWLCILGGDAVLPSLVFPGGPKMISFILSSKRPVVCPVGEPNRDQED